MSRGGRRAVVALVLAAGLLLGGQALAGFLADRWWIEAAAPAALPFFLRRTLLRGLLDLAATALASLWWAGHLLAILRAAGAPGTGVGGNPAVRRALHHRDARLWALGIALALGALMGLGASGWAEPLLLAWQGVRFGVGDPSLGLDIGVLTGSLPAWLRVHGFLTMIGVVTTGVALAGHFLAGTIRIGRGRVAITDAARRHLGLLLALLGAVIAAHQILTPYELAAGIPRPVKPGVVLLHRSVAFVLVGVSLAVIGLSVLWAVRPIHSLVAGAWLALSISLLAAFYFLPSGDPWPSTPEDEAVRDRLERLGYELPLREDSSLAHGSPTPSLWDPEVVASVTALDTSQAPPASRLVITSPPPASGRVWRSAWVGLRPGGVGGTAVLAVADDTVGPGGRPLFLRPPPDGGLGMEPRPLLTLPELSIRPGVAGVHIGEGAAGVEVGGWARRLALAWSLQSTVPLRANRPIGWFLDPAERLRHVAPFAIWSRPALVESDGRWLWLAHGLVTAEAFPGTRRQPWQGRRVSYARSGLLGAVDARDGRLELFLDPETDSLSVTWSRATAGFVQPADRLPPGVRTALDYPQELLDLQTILWMRSEAERLGRPVGELVASQASPTRTGWLVAVTDQRPGRLHAVLEGRYEGGRRALLVHRPDTIGLEAADVLERRWQRFPSLQVLRDSVTATGARFVPGRVRYLPTGDGLLAYQPSWAVSPTGTAIALSVVSVARRSLLGVGRSFPDALSRLRSGDAAAMGQSEGESAILFEARRWLREADSALRRGDLTAFARAFAALRTLLEGPEPPRRPPPPPPTP
ncbi:MAG TPA: UPF0182 family protein [Gemmatimonadales bacterium]